MYRGKPEWDAVLSDYGHWWIFKETSSGYCWWKSVTHTSEFLLTLESKMGFKISTVQTDNGREFTNMGSSERMCQFDVVAKWLKIEHKTTRPFSPWQNGKVERSHRRDGERFYNRSFRTIEVLCKAHKRYISRYNNIVQRTLGFKSPNELVTEFFLAHSAWALVTNVLIHYTLKLRFQAIKYWLHSIVVV